MTILLNVSKIEVYQLKWKKGMLVLVLIEQPSMGTGGDHEVKTQKGYSKETNF